MENLRIVLASDWYRPRKGGVETAIYNIAQTLLRHGHEPIIVTHQNRELPDPEPLEYDDGVPVVRFKVPIKGDDYTTSRKAAVLLHDFLKHNAVDVVHGHSMVSPFAMIAIHVAKGFLGIPTVATHHSLIAEDLNPIHRLMIRYGASRVDVLTAVSSVSKRDLEEIVGRQVELAYNCLDLNEWLDADGIDLEGDPILLFVSRLTERKNPLLALEAFRRVLRESPKARLYIIGWGPLEEKVRRYISLNNLEGKAILVGGLEREEVKKYMASSDIFLMPGRKEAFSLVTLEAQAHGLPVVGFRDTGVEDIIVDEENGYLVETDEEFIEKTVLLSSDEELRIKFSAHARINAKRFDCDRLYERYMEIYRSALDNCSREKRFLLYSLFRLAKLDPVKPGEWCESRKQEYYQLPPKRSCVPHIRRRARRATIPVRQL